MKFNVSCSLFLLLFSKLLFSISCRDVCDFACTPQFVVHACLSGASFVLYTDMLGLHRQNFDILIQALHLSFLFFFLCWSRGKRWGHGGCMLPLLDLLEKVLVYNI